MTDEELLARAVRFSVEDRVFIERLEQGWVVREQRGGMTMAIKLETIKESRAKSALECATIEATNNRRAVRVLRDALRWALLCIDPESVRGGGDQFLQAAELLKLTTPHKLAGKG